MKTKLTLIKYATLLLLLPTLNSQLSTFAQGTVFTYQGRLFDDRDHGDRGDHGNHESGLNNNGGSPVNGTHFAMIFSLYDVPTNGNLLGTLEIAGVSVSGGFYSVPLDFGDNFPGADRWLEISVQENGGAFTTLTPRQKLTPTPYAITASNLSGTLPAGQLTGTVPAGSLAGGYPNAVTLNNPANSFSGVFTGNGAGLTNIPTAGSAWQLTGNAGTAAGVNFLGTTDNQPLELKVNGSRALRLEPNIGGAPNVIGGSSVNFVRPGTVGAVIAGGGAGNYFGFSHTNSVAADFGSLGGGENNTIQANALFSTVGGGAGNTIFAYAPFSTIGGGGNNTIQINAADSVIGGGFNNAIQTGARDSIIGGGHQNTIQFNAGDSTISGGQYNTIQTNASSSTIGGGYQNIVQTGAELSTIAGGGANTIRGGSTHAAIGGGGGNMIQTNAPGSTISGGTDNIIQGNPGSFFYTLSLNSTIGGGNHNTVQTNASYSTIGGGVGNTIFANAVQSTIGGGNRNTIQTYASSSTISGGNFNTIEGSFDGYGPIFQGPSANSTIGGGDQNTIQTNAVESTISGGGRNTIQSGASDCTISGGGGNIIQTNASGSSIAGGNFNTIQGVRGGFYPPYPYGLSANSTIGGGSRNTIQSNSVYATIGGGDLNMIQTNTVGSTISGGTFNTIQSDLASAAAPLIQSSTISGGTFNTIQTNSIGSTISGGARNTIRTNVKYSTIGGGSNNTAAGNFATIPGGDQNVAGTNGFAAGHRAKATNTGTFVWADSAEADFASTGSNQFLIRASGGVGIGVNNPDAALTVNGDADKPGGGAWTVFSDARLKKNIEPLTGALNRLLELRAVTFEYKDPQSIHELPGVQIGMIAQEVEKIFPDWVDTAPNGMKRLSIHGFEALTVQAFRELSEEKESEIAALRTENEMQIQKLKNDKATEIFELKQRLEKLEQVVHNQRPD